MHATDTTHERRASLACRAALIVALGMSYPSSVWAQEVSADPVGSDDSTFIIVMLVTTLAFGALIGIIIATMLSRPNKPVSQSGQGDEPPPPPPPQQVDRCPYCSTVVNSTTTFCGQCDKVVYPAHNTALVVGRWDNEEADIRLRQSNVSSHHCELHCENGDLWVYDGDYYERPVRGSSNGTFVRDTPRSQWRRVPPGSMLKVSRTSQIRLTTKNSLIFQVPVLLGMRHHPNVANYNPLIDQYRIDELFDELEELSHAGATAIVYKARRRDTGQNVALKILRRSFCETETTVLKRFRREIALMERLSKHPGIVTLNAANSTLEKDPEGVWIALDFMAGGTLLDYQIERWDQTSPTPLEPLLICQWMIDLLQAIEHLHNAGIVHRDLKPDNILLDEHRENVILADLGIARVTENADHSGYGEHITNVGSGLHITQPGTIGYMAPEQCDHRMFLGDEGAYTFPSGRQLHHANTGVDVRADVFSCGIILAELCGAPNPVPQDVTDPILAIPYLYDFDPQEHVPDPFYDVVLKATKMRPCDRYESAAEMRQALVGIRAGMAQNQTLPPGALQ